MYILLAITTLVIATVNGNLIQCFIGGVTEDTCIRLMNESVLIKYYISNFEKWYGYSDDNDSEVISMGIDVPYINYEGNYPRHMNSNLFMTSLFKNNDSLEMYWNNYHLVGTDLFRLKFHSKMVNMHKNNYTFSPKEMLIFIKSCYNASSIYYFYKKFMIASNVLEDGIHFINILRYEESIDKIEVTTWSILYLTHKLYLIQENREYYHDTNIHVELQKLNDEKIELIKMIEEEQRKYPMAYLLIYREYFLDKKKIDENVQTLYNVINRDVLEFDETDTDLKFYLTYYHIVLSFRHNRNSSSNEMESLTNLLLAVKNPILHTEDRLLNYLATELLRNKYKFYTQNDIDNTIHGLISLQNVAYDNEVYGAILTNLQYRSIYPDINNIQLNDIKHIFKSNGDIDEILFKILIINLYDLEKGSQRIHFIIQAKNFLDDYVEFIKNQYNNVKKQMFQNKNVCLAFKWLSLFNGLIATAYPLNSNERKSHIDKSVNDLEFAITCMNSKNKYGNVMYDDDKVLQYLRLKFYSQVEELKNITVDGLLGSRKTISRTKVVKINYQDTYVKFRDFINEFDNIEVNKIEALIYMFGLKSEINYIEAMILLKKAISIPVINPEDRFRNKEVHELLNVFMIQHKNFIIYN